MFCTCVTYGIWGLNIISTEISGMFLRIYTQNIKDKLLAYIITIEEIEYDTRSFPEWPDVGRSGGY